MASSSSMSMRCFHCKASSATFIPGWRLRNGGFALLCQRCGYAFNEGTLCETFHPEESGWRECASCKKKIHCGCIMAAHTYTILDSTGVQCMECAINEAMAPHRCSLDFGLPEALLQATDSPQIPSADPEKMITGVDPISPPDCVIRNASPNKVATPTTPGHQAQSPPAETEEEDSVNSPDETKNSRRKNGGKRRKDGNKQTQIQYRYSPKISSEELREICRQSKSSLVPLFEKELTFSDAEFRNGRLLLPKRCAEAYFPKTSGQQGIFLTVQDTNGNAWELHFHYWTNSCGKMYVLEGLRDYKIQMQWEAGDTITFYKREADGQLVMGFKKNKAPVVVVKSSTDA
ncbi:B3 domain-containing protein Os07g0563300-like isoform X2 [Hibiscus syriacus]|uniref:B3 domain-containing protein Os07g0563300-like isoform X2 n=1 Tax=Hibiscus syriacus TaxID=106335 RepID=UPI001924334E|nr:B3 domain-containing protein Os07g0563300-like isoform X2 [Hibiscus syriacus]